MSDTRRTTYQATEAQIRSLYQVAYEAGFPARGPQAVLEIGNISGMLQGLADRLAYICTPEEHALLQDIKRRLAYVVSPEDYALLQDAKRTEPQTQEAGG